MAKPLIAIVLTSVALCATLALTVWRDTGFGSTQFTADSTARPRDNVSNTASAPLAASVSSSKRSFRASQFTELADNESPLAEPSVDYFQSLAAFRSYMDRTESHHLDLENVVEFVNISDSAFELIASRYMLSGDPVELSALGDVISESRHESKVALALALQDAPNPLQRQQAYRWLNDGVTSLTAVEVSNALLNASHHELDPSLLSAVLKAFPLDHLTNNSGLGQSLIYRLRELAMHPDDQVAKTAILELAEHAPSSQTLQRLHTELQSYTEARLLTALSGLAHFDSVDAEVMLTLETILNNPDLSRRVRAQAAKALVVFENKHSAPG